MEVSICNSHLKEYSNMHHQLFNQQPFDNGMNARLKGYSIASSTYRSSTSPSENMLDGDSVDSTYAVESVHLQQKPQLFIGGMSNTTSLKGLQNYLKGMVDRNSKLTISLVKRIKRNTFSGYAIIRNLKKEEAEALLRIGNFKYEGCWLGIKPFLSKKEQISQSRFASNLKKIYLKGLTNRVSETDLEEYFSYFGCVNHIKINKDQYTNEYKGFGFLEFDNQHAIDQLMLMPFHIINGTKIYCERSQIQKPSTASPTTTASQALSEGTHASDCGPDCAAVGCSPLKTKCLRPVFNFAGPEFALRCPSTQCKLQPNFTKMSAAINFNHAAENICIRRF